MKILKLLLTNGGENSDDDCYTYNVGCVYNT